MPPRRTTSSENTLAFNARLQESLNRKRDNLEAKRALATKRAEVCSFDSDSDHQLLLSPPANCRSHVFVRRDTQDAQRPSPELSAKTRKMTEKVMPAAPNGLQLRSIWRIPGVTVS